MTDEYKIIRGDQQTTFDDKDEFEGTVEFLNSEGEEFETVTPDDEAAADGGTKPTMVDEPDEEYKAEPVPDGSNKSDDLPQPSQLTSDPLDVISENADQFTDRIQGTVTINRQGYAVLAERFGISVEATPVTLPSETEFEYAEFKATATTEDGTTYSGFGSAHVKRSDGDDAYLLAELAETRAMKRATAWATGVGMTAVEELEGSMEAHE